MNLRDRLEYNRAILRDLQSKLSTLKNDRHYEQWRDILGKLGSGQHPTADDIISVKELFSEPPYKTASLSYTHIVCHSSTPSLLYLFHLMNLKYFIYRNIWPVYMASKFGLHENHNSPKKPCACIIWIWQLNVKVDQSICPLKHYEMHASNVA